MSNKTHEQHMEQQAEAANQKAVQLARLQDAFLNQIREDMMTNDLTALDELFYQMLKIEGAIPLLVSYLPEAEQLNFIDLVGEQPEAEL